MIAVVEVCNDAREAVEFSGRQCEAALRAGDLNGAAFWSLLAFQAVRS